jgi:hypothetical protein
MTSVDLVIRQWADQHETRELFEPVLNAVQSQNP